VLNQAAADHPGRFHFVGPLLPAAGPDALAAGGLGHLAERTDRRRIYVSMGTILGDMMRLGPEFFAPFIAAFGGDPRYELVVSIGKSLSPDAFGEVPPNVTLRPFVPQTALLPHVDVFVTHAGANSMHEALFHGVPMVCLPAFGDQPGNARRIAELGAGVTVPMKEVDAGRVRAAVEQVLGAPSFRESARRIGAELQRTGGVAEAVAVVERRGRVTAGGG
jgi:MGT family glycosyltransferase